MMGALHMGWRHVLFANWPVDPDVVEPHLPRRLTLDIHDGAAWLSVVPFTNVDVRPTWAPQIAGFPLPELNLRTYVTCDGRPGVYFFSLDAQGLLGVVGARLFHHLPYYYARIGLAVDGNRVRFRARRYHPGARPVAFRATYGPDGSLSTAESGSLAWFLTERYRYYTEATDGSIRYAAIDHDPWDLAPAAVDIETNTLFSANWFADPNTDPVHFYSPGVDTIASGSRVMGADV